GGSGGDSERVPGRLSSRAQSPPKPRRDRFVGAVAGERTRKSGVNLTFGGLLVKGAVIVRKTVRRSSSYEFLVWGLA
ncbi:hypothetical protein ALC60_09157, partial [Trachymyrmex zeteki]